MKNQKNLVDFGFDKRKIRDFWQEWDIYFSCSDWEGHSISQCEGIASGAVPVVTDVSGASDDICDGVNGYIVHVGEWKALADKICYLSEHRDILKQMSDAGMDRMRERNRLYKIMFWRNYVISFNYNAITKCS